MWSVTAVTNDSPLCEAHESIFHRVVYLCHHTWSRLGNPLWRRLCHHTGVRAGSGAGSGGEDVAESQGTRRMSLTDPSASERSQGADTEGWGFSLPASRSSGKKWERLPREWTNSHVPPAARHVMSTLWVIIVSRLTWRRGTERLPAAWEDTQLASDRSSIQTHAPLGPLLPPVPSRSSSSRSVSHTQEGRLWAKAHFESPLHPLCDGRASYFASGSSSFKMETPKHSAHFRGLSARDDVC